MAEFISFANDGIGLDLDTAGKSRSNEDYLLDSPGNFIRKRYSKKKKHNMEDQTLRNLLDDCEFYLTIWRRFADIKEEDFDLGHVVFHIDGRVDSLTSNQMWLYVSRMPKRSFLYWENAGKVKYYVVDEALDNELWAGLATRCFVLELQKDATNGNSVSLRVLLITAHCYTGTSLHETNLRNTVLKYFCCVDFSMAAHGNDPVRSDWEAVYAVMRGYNNMPCMTQCAQHELLTPTLRPYQQQAVLWMLRRETVPLTLDTTSVLFTEILTDCKQTFFYNKFDGSLCLHKPVSEPLPKGGILADEMGLGKTVEVLALILLNPHPTLCPANGVERGPSSYSTLHAISELGSEEMSQLAQHQSCSKSAQRTMEDSKGTAEGRVKKRKRMKVHGNRMGTLSTSVKRKSKGMNYQILEKWYNDMLSETVKRNPKFNDKISSVDSKGLKCVCGEDKGKLPRIQCCVCLNWQHIKCMGYPRAPSYKCPQCWSRKDPIDSGATLIVSPASISNQWLMESRKHIKDPKFRILFYKGVQKGGFMQPPDIADNHVVVTTYEILRKELVHADASLSEQPRLRYNKRFFAVPSPLLFVNWWRVCLDEAQMVEKTSSKTAEMAQRLSSVHRWAITGTPIQKTMQDLFGLIQFLGIEPYNLFHFWTRVLYTPYCNGDDGALKELLHAVMWRTVKKDVIHEINIPEQKHVVHWLNFSPIEEHFYRLQHSMCSQHFLLMCSKFEELTIPLKSLNRNVLHKLLKPLLRLRQACSHHQVVRGFHISQRGTMTMEELLESLMKKAKTDGEEALRRVVAALNGIAGIQIIKELWSEAVESYRNVLHLQEQYKDTLKSDTLQCIHTLYNLGEVLASHPQEISPTLRDGLLQQQARELEENYIKKQDMQVTSAQEALWTQSCAVRILDGTGVGTRNTWWADLSRWATVHDAKGELLARAHVELLDSHAPGQPSIINRIKTFPALEHQIALWSDSLFLKRREALMSLQNLCDALQLELANEAVDCHLRSSSLPKKKRKCRLCSYDAFLKEYESILFAVSNKQQQHSFVGEVMIMSNLNQGTWQPSEQEKVLRVLLAFARNKRAPSELLDEGSQFLKMLEAMKKEFKQLRYTWTQIRDRTSVQDELHMAKLRMRVRFEDEPLPTGSHRHNPLQHLSSNVSNELETIHIIESHEIEAHAVRFDSDRILAEAQLRRRVGQLQYLKSLEKHKGCQVNPDMCPICRVELGEKWSVMHCGHCFCIECIRLLMQSCGLRTVNVKCPICRDVTQSGDISFVDISRKAVEENWQNISVVGSHSTKVDAVVRCLLAITAESEAKALVFSTWEKVLDVLTLALTQNKISFRRLQSGPKYKENLNAFKESSSDRSITVLLMPVRLGAKGLNLIEATHVLLVDPMLNPADEQQAIGRVHRFGQTRETTVHHFLIRGSVEERIYGATQSCAEKWSDNCVTIQQLQDLFSSCDEVMK